MIDLYDYDEFDDIPRGFGGGISDYIYDVAKIISEHPELVGRLIYRLISEVNRLQDRFEDSVDYQ